MNKQEFLEYASALWTVNHATVDSASAPLVDLLKNAHATKTRTQPCVSPEGWGVDAAHAMKKACGTNETIPLNKKLHLIAEYYQSAPLLKLAPPPYALPNDPADDDPFEKTRRALIDTINLAHTCLVPLCETLEILGDNYPPGVDPLVIKELRDVRDRAVDTKRALVDLAYAVGHLSPEMEKQMDPDWFDCLAYASRTEHDLFYAFCMRYSEPTYSVSALADGEHEITFNVRLSERLHITATFGTNTRCVGVEIHRQ